MNNTIDTLFRKKDKMKIMTHVVAGYPDKKTNKEVIKLMARYGVDLIEIQIPFSDPMADGPTIMKANQSALERDINVDDCFKLVKDLKKEIDIPLLFMTYANIPFNIGIEKFISNSVNAGISGLIIPDLPFDEDNNNYIETAKSLNIHPIQVISADMKKERIKKISEIASGFIYTTLKVGITGAQKTISKDAFKFLKSLKNIFPIPIAAGFGISSKQHIEQLRGFADIAIIGSQIINVFDKSGLKGVERFLKEIRS